MNINKEIERIITLTIKDISFCPYTKLKDKLIPCRKLSLIPENAKTVIMCAFPYIVNKDYSCRTISKYACVADYHVVVGELLDEVCRKLELAYPNNKFVSFTDNSPIPEVLAGVKSGLGVLGKNSLLITREYGSFVFLGEIVTDIETETTWLEETPTCYECGMCENCCPSQCVGKDKTSCASNLSQLKRDLTSEEISKVKKSGLMWGCDVCQDVCPMNKNVTTTYIEQFKRKFCLDFADDYRTSDFPYAYLWRGAKVIERNKILFAKDNEKNINTEDNR